MRTIIARILNTALLLVLFSLSAVMPSEGKKVKTTLKIEKKSQREKSKHNSRQDETPTRQVAAGEESIIDNTERGSLKFVTDSVIFSGYEKSLSAKKETLFITNNNHWPMKGAKVKITYLDMQGRMLHSRNVIINCDVPPHETRRAEFKTWDTQGDFYYHQSVEPRRVATPYMIDFEPVSFTIPLP